VLSFRLRRRERRPLSQVGHPRSGPERFVELQVVFSLESREPMGFAGEATVASSGVVENAVQRR
jgi:hypothetical protein